MISIIIPIYKEVENISIISNYIKQTLLGKKYEIIFIDDNSDDGTELLCKQLSKSLPIRHIIRNITNKKDRGLAISVIEGFKYAKGEFIVIMDADMSHPPEAILKMVNLLDTNKADFVVGSRYISGGSIDNKWTIFNRINSFFATILAKPLVKLEDPLSGFFALKREKIPDEKILNPIGYKICIELIVKCNFKKIKEIPIHFFKRMRGKSKTGLRERINYLIHLRRLYIYQYSFITKFIHFCFVGFTGFLIDISVYYILKNLGLNHIISRAISFWPAVSWNWILNRLITFNNRPKTSKIYQWIKFCFSSFSCFIFSWGIYYLLTNNIEFFYEKMFISFVLGVLAGTIFNFTASNFFIYKK